MSMGSQPPSLHITGLGASKFKNLNTLLSHLTRRHATCPALTKRCINIKAISTLYTDTDQAPLRVPIIPLLARNPTEYKLEWLSSSGDIWQASLSPKSSISFLPRHSDFTFYLQQVNKAPQNLVQIKARKKHWHPAREEEGKTIPNSSLTHPSFGRVLSGCIPRGVQGFGSICQKRPYVKLKALRVDEDDKSK